METIPTKNMLIRTKNDFWFSTDYTMNIYRGCSHGCIYCDSRSECYGIADFNRVRAKENALLILSDNLRRKKLKGVIGTGSMSDPYNPLEQKYQLTRQALELFKTYGFGAAIATKSPLVTRDKDLLKTIQKHSPVIVKLTITCAEDALAKIIEPRVAPTSERFTAIKELSENDIFAGILLMPILPFINDTVDNIKKIVALAAQHGAQFIYPAFGMTLRDQQRLFFYDQLDRHFPGIKKEYLKHFGNQYHCTSPNAKLLWSTFTRECQRHQILYQMSDIVTQYKLKHGGQQLSFLP